jgi:hypothetical protein
MVTATDGLIIITDGRIIGLTGQDFSGIHSGSMIFTITTVTLTDIISMDTTSTGTWGNLPTDIRL